MAKIDLAAVPIRRGSGYPAPFDAPCAGRIRQAIGDAASLTQFGVNLLRLAPGAWSSQRHWHVREDELVWVLAGEVVLVTDAGEQTLAAGECAGFPAGDANGHHFQNRGEADALLLEIGTRDPADAAHYPDIDLFIDNRIGVFSHRDGTPY